MIVRHAAAFDRDTARWPDDDARPLTPEGIELFRQVARGLGRVAPEVSALLSFAGGDIGPGAGRLEWLLPPLAILKLR